MRTKFHDSEDLMFEYHPSIPQRTVNLRINNPTSQSSQTLREPAYKLNLAALHLYGLYRNAVYDSYQQKPDLAADIKKYNKVYQEQENTRLSQAPSYQDPLYHYSVTASLDAMRKWQNKKNNIQCYIASKYHPEKQRYIPIGFLHFNEDEVDNKPVVYIAQMGAAMQNQGIGRRLMECVLAHYPAGTEFYVLTRVSNKEAKALYKQRFKFDDISKAEIKQLGYDKRYCGYKHITTMTEIQIIKQKLRQGDDFADTVIETPMVNTPNMNLS